MDDTAFQELIAQARGATAALAQAEQRVAAFKDELAQQAEAAGPVAPVRSIKSLPKRVSGWVAAADKPRTARGA